MRIEDEIKSNFTNDYQKLAVNIHLTSARIGEKFKSEIKASDLTSTQYNVLRILRGQHGSPASIGLIKERMIERNSDVSRIIERLVKKKLIKRKENPKDRRLKDVLITQSGLNLLGELDKLEEAYKHEFAHLTINEINLLNDLLDKVRSNPL